VLCSDIEALIARGTASGGMVPKLRSAKNAVEGGVGEVRIAGFHGDLGAVGGTIVRLHAHGETLGE
jgi:acetylglutamate kinase